MNKVLIITYYWPPSGGSGVQRWLKFVKYLSQMGWEPIVFTPENPSFTIQDNSLLKDVPQSVEVIKLPIWEPYYLFFKISKIAGKKSVKQSDFISTGKKSIFQKLSSFIRGNFFIPDARIFWVKPSVSFLEDFIKSNKIDRIITTGPPHSIHLIGLKLKEKNPSLKWVADFRDPWSEWDLLDTLSLTRLARSRHKNLEKKVLTMADRIITIAPYHVKRLEALSGRQVDLITNGFDEDDFKGIVHQKTSKFTIRHIGVVDELRDPRPVMEVIKAICLKDDLFQQNVLIEFIGNVNSTFKSYVMSDIILKSVARFVDQVPHAQLLKLYGETDLQLLVLAHTSIAPGNLPGKFFEYLASGNPILGIGPVDGDAGMVLSQSGGGKIFERSNEVGIKEAIQEFYLQWTKGDLTPNAANMVYSRKQLTQQLIRILAPEI
ncbi:MAG: glycosyltransferase family 4 protein [Cyclobacteriaceae bacterium]|nr:glycosyltransferase family 4 protein [Cyclobacteriaceae bacterium]